MQLLYRYVAATGMEDGIPLHLLSGLGAGFVACCVGRGCTHSRPGGVRHSRVSDLVTWTHTGCHQLNRVLTAK
jgi:hypothetical protein